MADVDMQRRGEQVMTVDRMHVILTGSIETLLATWSDEHSLFPFSSRVGAEGIVQHDYDTHLAVRYTINSLLGLSEAAGAGLEVDDGLVARRIDTFLDRQAHRVTTLADVGLLTLLLSKRHDERATEWLKRLGSELATSASRDLSVQDLAWAAWGACGALKAGHADAEHAALAARARLLGEFMEPRTGLPRHSVRAYRRAIVSFGAVTYFLRAMHELGQTLADDEAEDHFLRGVTSIAAIQGPRGEWPWMIDNRHAEAFDFYPVFSVHQDSMAMLFLLPALDRGMDVARAIRLSANWIEGANECALRFYELDPFWAYRSLERSDRFPKARRFARALEHSVRRRPPTLGVRGVRLNSECRSYHLGWLLFAWSPRPEFGSVATAGLTRVLAQDRESTPGSR
jgi:hypothetical protein